ncbi:MAG: hypothetical protein ACF8QF_04005 [Phycisphaerales bacterium]
MPGADASWKRCNDLLFVTLDSVEGVTFYPELRFQGLIVHPMKWQFMAEEPVLVVMAGRWTRTVLPEEAEAFMESTRQRLHWTWDHHHGSGGCVHVDELEKLEGPPPAGPF